MSTSTAERSRTIVVPLAAASSADLAAITASTKDVMQTVAAALGSKVSDDASQLAERTALAEEVAANAISAALDTALAAQLVGDAIATALASTTARDLVDRAIIAALAAVASSETPPVAGQAAADDGARRWAYARTPDRAISGSRMGMLRMIQEAAELAAAETAEAAAATTLQAVARGRHARTTTALQPVAGGTLASHDLALPSTAASGAQATPSGRVMAPPPPSPATPATPATPVFGSPLSTRRSTTRTALRRASSGNRTDMLRMIQEAAELAAAETAEASEEAAAARLQATARGRHARTALRARRGARVVQVCVVVRAAMDAKRVNTMRSPLVRVAITATEPRLTSNPKPHAASADPPSAQPLSPTPPPLRPSLRPSPSPAQLGSHLERPSRSVAFFEPRRGSSAGVAAAWVAARPPSTARALLAGGATTAAATGAAGVGEVAHAPLCGPSSPPREPPHTSPAPGRKGLFAHCCGGGRADDVVFNETDAAADQHAAASAASAVTTSRAARGEWRAQQRLERATVHLRMKIGAYGRVFGERRSDRRSG